jgi:hypothetical protein
MELTHVDVKLRTLVTSGVEMFEYAIDLVRYT